MTLEEWKKEDWSFHTTLITIGDSYWHNNPPNRFPSGDYALVDYSCAVLFWGIINLSLYVFQGWFILEDIVSEIKNRQIYDKRIRLTTKTILWQNE